MHGMFVIIHGNFGNMLAFTDDAVAVTGPFDTYEEAKSYADEHCVNDWHVFGRSSMNVESVKAIIQQVQDNNEQAFHRGRYPYTYAFDYVRQYHQIFHLPQMPSRAQVGNLLDAWCEDEYRQEVIKQLADAFLYANNIRRTCDECGYDYIEDPDEGCDACVNLKVKVPT